MLTETKQLHAGAARGRVPARARCFPGTVIPRMPRGLAHWVAVVAAVSWLAAPAAPQEVAPAQFGRQEEDVIDAMRAQLDAVHSVLEDYIEEPPPPPPPPPPQPQPQLHGAPETQPGKEERPRKAIPLTKMTRAAADAWLAKQKAEGKPAEEIPLTMMSPEEEEAHHTQQQAVGDFDRNPTGRQQHSRYAARGAADAHAQAAQAQALLRETDGRMDQDPLGQPARPGRWPTRVIWVFGLGDSQKSKCAAASPAAGRPAGRRKAKLCSLHAAVEETNRVLKMYDVVLQLGAGKHKLRRSPSVIERSVMVRRALPFCCALTAILLQASASPCGTPQVVGERPRSADGAELVALTRRSGLKSHEAIPGSQGVLFNPITLVDGGDRFTALTIAPSAEVVVESMVFTNCNGYAGSAIVNLGTLLVVNVRLYRNQAECELIAAAFPYRGQQAGGTEVSEVLTASPGGGGSFSQTAARCTTPV